MKYHYKALIFGSLVFVSAGANAAIVSFNNGDNGSASFALVSEGITYTFSNPSADSTFTIQSNQLLFGIPPGGSPPSLTQFTLTASGGDGLLSGYQTGNQTASGDKFNITGPNTNNQYNNLQGNTASLNTFLTPLVLLNGQTYTFDYLLDANNPADRGITGLGGIVVAPVPIPAAVWLLGSALIGLGSIRRKAVAR